MNTISDSAYKMSAPLSSNVELSKKQNKKNIDLENKQD